VGLAGPSFSFAKLAGHDPRPWSLHVFSNGPAQGLTFGPEYLALKLTLRFAPAAATQR
jgi:hypothetical protein